MSKKTATAVEDAPVTHEEGADSGASSNCISAKELAAKLGTDPKSCRRFLRKQSSVRPGKGGRWEIDVADVAKLTELFQARSQRADVVDADDETDEDILDELED